MSTNAAYSYFAYARGGLGGGITQADSATSQARAPLDLDITLKNAGQATANVKMYGPGDVEGIDPQQIVRVEPSPGERAFAPNLFPLIEFDRPDYPWLFSPFAPQSNRLRPWLILIVVRQRPEIDLDPESRPMADPRQPLPVLTIDTPSGSVVASVPDEELPDLADAWAWAHVQAVGDVAASGTGDQGLDRTNAKHPERVVSRIISPRRLRENTTYIAALVPAFEAGRLAGLGQDPVATLAPAWRKSTAQSPVTQVTLPVYHHWEFTTSPAGDFASLVQRLKPVTAPPGVGSRPIDASDPGGGLPAAGARPPGPGPPPAHRRPALFLQGALKATGATLGADPDPRFQNKLETVLNSSAPSATAPAGALVVTPPIYGGVAAGREGVPAPPPAILGPPLAGLGTILPGPSRPTGPPLPIPAPPAQPDWQPPWLRELNLDPRHRAAAALGTKVVQDRQEELMAAAWTQVGEVLRANELLRKAQLARGAGGVVHARLGRLDAGVLLALTARAHARVPPSEIGHGTETLAAVTQRSRLPGRCLGPTFRRAIRPRGPLARRFDPAGVSRFRFIHRRINAGLLELEPVDPLTKTLLRPIPDGAQLIPDPGAITQQAVDGAGTNIDLVPVREEGAPSSIEPARLKAAASTHQKSFDRALTLTGPAPAPALDALLQPLLPAPPPTLAKARAVLLSALNPESTLPPRVRRRIGNLPARPVEDVLEPLRFTPQFPTPMFSVLREQGEDYVLPGIDLLPSDCVTGLEVNNRFVNSFMIGLNHEMSRELLWREFPADLRGTYFSQFWDPAGRVPPPNETTPPDLRDLTPIHTWAGTRQLGEGAGAAARGKLVVAVRGELLQRFPGTIVYLAKATAGTVAKPEPGTEELHPVFRVGFEPDLTFFGFDISTTAARGTPPPGYFVVFQQQPTEPRYGLVEAEPLRDPGAAPKDWEFLSWGHLAPDENSLEKMVYAPATPPASATPAGAATTPAWGTNSAQMAVIALQDPVRVAIHASDIVPPS